MSWQNKVDSGPFSALSACANETVVNGSCIIVTSSFSKTKGSFCFSFSKRSLEDALEKMCFFAYVISQEGSKLQGKKHAEHCLRHLNKTACETWSVLTKFYFAQNTYCTFSTEPFNCCPKIRFCALNCDLQIRFCALNCDLQIQFCELNCDLQIQFCALNCDLKIWFCALNCDLQIRFCALNCDLQMRFCALN